MLVQTTKGPMDHTLLEKKEIKQITPTGVANATEYWLKGELVHRSVHFVFNPDYVPKMGGKSSL